MNRYKGTTDLDKKWWKEAVVYQIYPRSFNDTNGDGIGDLPGIIEKLDYLKSLGVDVLWLSPIYESPNADNGYDISNYRRIMPEMGRMKDWEKLLEEVHNREIKLIMDLVVNHTSDEHEWFQRSRNREKRYEDYYIWRDPDEKGNPPNNWQSIFGGPAWKYDEKRGQYYLHLFDTKQPDLNWDNEQVRQEIYEMMRWWLEKGIDGFRMDVINLISKREGLPDGDPKNDRVGSEHFFNGPRVHEYIREMYEETISKYDVMTVAEMPGVTIEKAKKYLGESGDGLNMLFNFDLVDLTYGESKWSLDGFDTDNLQEENLSDYDLVKFKKRVKYWQNGLEREGWNSIYLANHDHPRLVSRFGNDENYREKSAKLFATYLLTMRGTVYLYQGDEIGMTSVEWNGLNELRDVDAINHVKHLMEKHDLSFEEIKSFIRERSRENSRTSMQWSDDKNAGFTEGDPWIKVNPNYKEINVEDARKNNHSIWHYYRDLIELRHEEEVLVYGDFKLLLEDDSRIFAFLRTLDEDRMLILLNFSKEETEVKLPKRLDQKEAKLLIGNYKNAGTKIDMSNLRPWEARVYELQ